MTCRERLEAYLRREQAPFGVHPHPPAQGHAEYDHIPERITALARLVVADGAPVLLAAPASRELDLALAGAALGAGEVRPADAGELAATFVDCEPDALPPFGNLYGVPVLVDRTLEADRAIFFPAGTHATSLSIAYADFKRLAEPAVAEFTHPRRHSAQVGGR